MQDLPTIGNAELDLLKHLADSGPASVRMVSDNYGQSRGIGRTTVLKTLDRLREKGYVDREEVAGSWHYRSIHSREELETGVISRFVEDALGGTIQPFVAYLHGQESLSAQDISDLKALVEKLEKGGEQ